MLPILHITHTPTLQTLHIFHTLNNISFFKLDIHTYLIWHILSYPLSPPPNNNLHTLHSPLSLVSPLQTAATALTPALPRALPAGSLGHYVPTFVSCSPVAPSRGLSPVAPGFTASSPPPQLIGCS